MKITVKNLGILRQAEFEIGDLTVICGNNNTGKTYATYAFYGFLIFWNNGFSYKLLREDETNRLISGGSVKINLDVIKRDAQKIVKNACEQYCQQLPAVFASENAGFKESKFSVVIDQGEINALDEYSEVLGAKEKPILNVSKKSGDAHVTVSLMVKTENADSVDKDFIEMVANREILHVTFGSTFTAPFIASAERTGAAIFRKELDFSRNRLLEHMSNNKKGKDPMDLLSTIFDRGYALPVNRDVDFIRSAEDMVKRESVLTKNNPEILSSFRDILGGEYRAIRDAVYFVPKKNVRLKLGESASSVRSLLDVGLYVRHIAKPGDVFMIDEPELNLHPSNQRNMARLLARLVNAGIRVFITTHSDYIIKEFNTLMMFHKRGAAAAGVMDEYGYCDKEILDPARVRAYVAKETLIKPGGALQNQRANTFVRAAVSGDLGIEIESFDETINVMNEIHEELIFRGN